MTSASAQDVEIPSNAKSSRQDSVLAFGTNLFGQIASEPGVQIQPLSGPAKPSRVLLAYASRIVATSTSQTVYLDREGELTVLGQSVNLLCQVLKELDDVDVNEIRWIGRDVFVAVLTRQAYFFLDTLDRTRVPANECYKWRDAASDGRGRIMAIDQEGQAYLFTDVDEFRNATLLTKHSGKLRQKSCFLALPLDSTTPRSSSTSLPRFETVSAGFSHFVLLAENAADADPVWIYGDTRFGVVPLHPFEGTVSVGVVTQASNDKADFRLIPVPFFSQRAGFPSKIRAVGAGSRHTLVLTQDGDAYGWGWNEDACLSPLSMTRAGDHFEFNVEAEPTLIDLPEEESIASISASVSRSFLVTTKGNLYVAGSNEFGCCAVPSDPTHWDMAKKPRVERQISQIKKEYECVNGFQKHPWFGDSDNTLDVGGDRVRQVHATPFATFVTLESMSN